MTSTLPTTSARDQRPSARWVALMFVALAQLMIALDATIVNIALPSMQEDLGFSDELRQWVVTAYALSFGSLLLFGGRRFDLVIANAALPGLDGITLLRLKHEKGIHSPTILLTGDGRLPDGVTAESHGVVSPLGLPLDAGALFGAVTAAFAMG